MLYTKVRNKDECGIHIVTVSFGNFYGMTGLSSKRLAIKHVQIVQDDTMYKDSNQNSIQFLLSSFMPSKVEFNVELDLYLIDGRVIELWTKDPSVLKAATPFMTMIDPRTKYREMRNSTNAPTRTEQRAKTRLAEYSFKLSEIETQMDEIKYKYVSDYGLDIFANDTDADAMLNRLLSRDKAYQQLIKRGTKIQENISSCQNQVQLQWKEC